MFNAKNFFNVYYRSVGQLAIWITAGFIIINQIFDGVNARLYLDMQLALILATIPNTALSFAICGNSSLSRWQKRTIEMFAVLFIDMFFMFTIALNHLNYKYLDYIIYGAICLLSAFVYWIIYDAIQKRNIKKINEKLNKVNKE